MVARPEWIIFVRAAKRIRVGKRWGEDCVNWVQWAPWHRYKDADDMDGEIPEGVEAPGDKEGEVRPKIVIESRDPVPWDFYISK